MRPIVTDAVAWWSVSVSMCLSDREPIKMAEPIKVLGADSGAPKKSCGRQPLTGIGNF